MKRGVMDKADILSILAKIRKIGGVKAVPPGVEYIPSAELSPVSLRRLFSDASRVAQNDLRLLKQAGWTFIAASEEPDSPGLEVLLDSDGHLKLSGRSLVAKLDPTLDREEIDALLSRSGLEVRRTLGFAPNTFMLDVIRGSALSAAESLNALEEIVYAEPNLVEPIRGRSGR